MRQLTILLSLCILLLACNKQAGKPAAVIDGMFTAMKNGNLDSMKKYITRNDAAMLEAAEQILTKADPEGMQKIKTRITEEMKSRIANIDYRVKQETIDGDRATVETEIILTDSTSANGQKNVLQKFELVKEDDVWKIALTKPGNELFNSMKGNRGAQDWDLKSGINTLQNMDADSVKMLIKKGLNALDSLNKKR